MPRTSTSSGDAPLTHVADSKFVERGVKIEDLTYPITVMDDELYLLSRLEVGKTCDFDEAASIRFVEHSQGRLIQ